MKNFQDVLIQSPQTISDPYKYTTPEVENEMVAATYGKISKLILGTSIAHIITAPLQTIVTSMQLSVLPHKDIFVSSEARTKQLARLNTQLTIAQKRKLELMIRSGGQFQPYVAPVYTSYQQAIRNLSKQGWKAFFKGLTFRLMHNLPHIFFYGAFFKLSSQNQSKMFGFSFILFQCYVTQTLVNMSMNMFHIMENRYILQNNIKEFKVFRNFVKALTKIITRGQMFKGSSYHALNVFVQLFLKFPPFLVLMTAENFNPTTMAMYYLSELLIYPFNTAYKRFICQSSAIPGMIPVRYSSVGHAVKVIAFQEKIKGLWRGFGLHNISIITRILILKVIFQNVEIVGKSQF